MDAGSPQVDGAEILFVLFDTHGEHRAIGSRVWLVERSESTVDNRRPDTLRVVPVPGNRAWTPVRRFSVGFQIAASCEHQFRLITKAGWLQRQVAAQNKRLQPAACPQQRCRIVVREPNLEEGGAERTDVAVQFELNVIAPLGIDIHHHHVTRRRLRDRGDFLQRKPADAQADQRQHDDDDDGMASPEHQAGPVHAGGRDRVFLCHRLFSVL